MRVHLDYGIRTRGDQPGSQSRPGTRGEAGLREMRGEDEMTHPLILEAERTGSPFPPDRPVLHCEGCGEGIYENEGYYDIGICESCADLYTWTHYPDDGDEPLFCACCGDEVEPEKTYVSLPNGDGDFCAECFGNMKTTAWAG